MLSVLRDKAGLAHPPCIKPCKHRSLSGGHSRLILSAGAALPTSGHFRDPRVLTRPRPNVPSVVLRNPTRGAPKAQGFLELPLLQREGLWHLCDFTQAQRPLISGQRSSQVAGSFQTTPAPHSTARVSWLVFASRGLPVAASRPLSQEGKAEHWDQVQLVYRFLLTAPLPSPRCS